MDLLKDNVKKLFRKFVIPAVSGAVAVTIYSLVDTLAIGRGVGPDGAAACALILPVFAISSFIALICGIGGSVLMSKARGGGNREKGDAYFTAATVLVALLTAAACLLGNLFQDELYRLCGANDTLLPFAREYGEWIFAFLPCFVATNFLGSFIRTDGSPKFVMFATLTGGVINIIGDYVLVFPLGMGMKGAAIATVAGALVQAIMLLGYIFAKKTALRFVRPHQWGAAVRKIFSTGFGAGVGSLALVALSVIANNQIMKYEGDTALAVYGVLGTLSALFDSIFSGVGQAAQPISSQNYGAGNMDRCRAVGGLGLKTALIFGGIFAAVSIAFPVEITGLFMKMTPEVEAAAPYILRVYSISYIPLAVNIFAVYYLQSVIRPKQAAMISLLRGIFLNGALLFLFPLIFGGKGIWWAILAAEAATMIAAAVCLRAVFWRKEEEASL